MTASSSRTVFLGTPETAIPSLEIVSHLSDVALVVTRPDRPRGRSKTPVPPPLKEAAMQLGLAVAQPENRQGLEAALMEAGEVDVGVVVAFGMIIPAPLLALPKRGMINVHFSLLPRWRGASPVQAALMAGDRETGITIMHMDEGLDTGPILAAASTTIGPPDNGGVLSSRLASMGAGLLNTLLGPILAGKVPGYAQSVDQTTYAPRLTAADRRLHLDMAPSVAEAKVRALAPRPGAVLDIDGQTIGILEARSSLASLSVGQIDISGDHLIVGMTAGSLEILTVQPPGKRKMEAADWLRGLGRPPGRAH